jgi:hypothetical protein
VAIPPLFLVNVAAKRLSFFASALESVLAEVLVSVDSAGLGSKRLR